MALDLNLHFISVDTCSETGTGSSQVLLTLRQLTIINIIYYLK